MSGGVVTTISTGGVSPPSLANTRSSPTSTQENTILPANSNTSASAASYLPGVTSSVPPSKPPRVVQKPRPLRLGSVAGGRSSAWDHGSTTNQLFSDSMPIGELLTLMEQVNRAVKSGHFTVLLANQIHRLYNQLKYCGEMLENSNKSKQKSDDVCFDVGNFKDSNFYRAAMVAICSFPL
ncbi:unnamed protein product [Soboliphyme baturini]|uniref:Abi_HHR domain-containing protein n=1 Tax=Soboliphyme baturini TaxID=241478 RepID=A0A183J6W6_9BILA|nr:unnamed protein product [Soboliphyme baturini]